MTKKTTHDQTLMRSLYTQMLLLRRFEERCGQLYGMGLIGGFCHLYIGQEAVVTGALNVRESGDQVITAYRDHAHAIACGLEPKHIFSELMGRKSGVSGGKGGSMHIFDPKKDFYGGHGVVGASIPIGTGLAFANQYRGNKNVCLTFFGDGAINQGQAYESFNMAALWQLPVLYIIENNQYAMGTSIARSTIQGELYRRGECVGIPGKRIDGMRVEVVLDEVKKALQYIRSGKGPLILEAMTYRYRGHSMSDPGKYRSREEVEEFKNHNDPLLNCRNLLLENKMANEDFFKDAESKIKSDLLEAIEFAKADPEPSLDALWTNVLTDTRPYGAPPASA